MQSKIVTNALQLQVFTSSIFPHYSSVLRTAATQSNKKKTARRTRKKEDRKKQQIQIELNTKNKRKMVFDLTFPSLDLNVCGVDLVRFVMRKIETVRIQFDLRVFLLFSQS